MAFNERMTRQAISPRLAMSTFLNIAASCHKITGLSYAACQQLLAFIYDQNLVKHSSSGAGRPASISTPLAVQANIKNFETCTTGFSSTPIT
jgi:hypothetical protein